MGIMSEQPLSSLDWDLDSDSGTLTLCCVAWLLFFPPQARCPRFPADCIKFPSSTLLVFFCSYSPSTLTGACSREAYPWHCLHNASPRGCGDVSVHRSLFQLTSSSFIFEVLRVAFSLSHCNKTATGEAPGQLTDCLSNGCTSDDLGVSY